MSDFSQYPYSALLQYIESGCRKIGEERDYVNYLLSMEEAESIEELIKIYNNIFKLLAVIFFGTHNLPSNWYIIETWSYYASERVGELNCFFNENILNWYKRQTNITSELPNLCLSNLRNSENANIIQKDILNNPSINAIGSATHLCYVIREHSSDRQKIENGVQNKEFLMNRYISNSKCLAGNGRIFDVAEVAFGKAKGISYEPLAEQYLEELKNEEKERRRKEKYDSLFNPDSSFNKMADTVGGSFFSFILSLPFAFLGAIFGGFNKRR